MLGAMSLALKVISILAAGALVFVAGLGTGQQRQRYVFSYDKPGPYLTDSVTGRVWILAVKGDVMYWNLVAEPPAK